MQPQLLSTATMAKNLAAQTASIGVKTPRALSTALDAFDRAYGYGNEIAGPDVNLDSMTVAPADVSDLIERMVDAAIRRQATLTAADEVADRLARRVSRELAVFGPVIVEALAPSFNEAAATFTDAYRSLPPNLNPERLVAAGHETLARFETARAASDTLQALAISRDWLADLGVRAPGSRDVETGTRYCTPRWIEAAQRARTAPRHEHFGRWAGILDTRGVTDLRWRILDEQAVLIAGLVSEPAPQLVPRTDGFRGSVEVYAE